VSALQTIIETPRALWRYRHILVATTRIELKKRYAGTYLGPIWLVVYPALFLAMYMFLYMVVFKVRFPGLGEFSYVVLVFCGLVPYLALMETASTATSVIRQNIHLIKNVMLPIDLMPARVALTALAVQIPGLAILIGLSAVDGSLSSKLLLLPLAWLLEAVFLLGIAFHLAVLGGLLPDLQASINIVLIFLLFVSPIGFPSDQVPSSAEWILLLNPVTHLINIFRSVLLAAQPIRVGEWFAFTAGSVLLFATGVVLFRRFKGYIVDHE
jgi:lipopolysaccharide transport system permease protein